jgi:hypothetical protein
MAEVVFIPGVVDGCATAARGVAATASGVANGFTATGAAAAEFKGLASAQALGACLTAWSGQLTTESGDISGTADNLHRAVLDHTAVDDHNARQITSAGRIRAI